MLIAVIQAVNYHSARQQIQTALPYAEGIELRLDYWESSHFNDIKTLRQEFSLPMIFTLRKKSQGGLYQHDEIQRLKNITTLCELEPDYFDLECDIPKTFAQAIHATHPKIKLICSYHNFNETPHDLSTVLQNMQQSCFHIYKIATHANSTDDANRMLQFAKENQKIPMIGICMGELGKSTRILGPSVGNVMNYGCIDRSLATAPGQLTLEELSRIGGLRRTKHV